MTAEAPERPRLPPHLTKVRLHTAEASEYLLAAHGVTVAPSTLAKLRSVGGGPQFDKFLSSVLYRPAALDAWVAQKMTASSQSGEPEEAA
ncbi:MAG: hypothetical protein ACR652_03335 [Methylocystis sp.]|uniref:hypothetical protein n=1 Tax=Methylocystis sp. TaxID=1911079 RepID=UPI003DA34B1A